MYKKILVPLDGSELAERVIPHVTALAKGTGAMVPRQGDWREVAEKF